MVQSCLKLKPCVKCGAWVGWDEAPNPHCIPSCDAQEERLTRKGGVMNSTRYCPMCGVSFDTAGRCGCHVSYGATARWEPPISLGAVAAPDRPARIREKCDELYRAWLTMNDSMRQAWSADEMWEAAKKVVDDLDRLEAEERAKEAEK